MKGGKKHTQHGFADSPLSVSLCLSFVYFLFACVCVLIRWHIKGGDQRDRQTGIVSWRKEEPFNYVTCLSLPPARVGEKELIYAGGGGGEEGRRNIISANCCERQKGKKENGLFCFGSKRAVDGLIIAGK